MKPRENPAACPKCGAHWDFATDAIGRLVEVHPVTACVPKQFTHTAECSVCEKDIRLECDPGRRILFWCSERCRLELKERKRLRELRACKRYQTKQNRLKRIYGRAA